jgi:hypothetical protein
MGWYTIAPPGSSTGPCVEACKHTDCAATRKQAEGSCLICGKPVGYDVPIYFTDDGIEHFKCYHKKQEDKDNAE